MRTLPSLGYFGNVFYPPTWVGFRTTNRTITRREGLLLKEKIKKAYISRKFCAFSITFAKEPDLKGETRLAELVKVWNGA